jgi:galactose mutarotase-like enzyme
MLRGLLEGARRIVSSRRGPVVPPYSFGYADLRGGAARVAVIPELGGKISVLEMAGRQWLWSNPAMPHRPPIEGLPYAENSDSGGFDECFPTIAPCQLPSAIRGFGGAALPDHGELWSQRTGFELVADGEPRAMTTWRGQRLPYEMTRSIRVTGEGSVVMDYRVINTGSDPFPYLWSAQPLMQLTSRTRIILPEGIRGRIAFAQGIDLGGGTREQRWPHFRLGDRIVDMSRPDAVPKKYACKIFFEMPTAPIAIEEGDVRLEIEASQVPSLGLWINRGGWSPNKRVAAYRNLALEPCIGAPDSLSDALGDWKSANWLAPGEGREWRLIWRARPLTSGTPSARETPAESRLQSR